MEVLFYVLCVTFFLSLFILKFKWFKKIGAWLAKPFVKLMKKRHEKKKNKQVVAEKSDRLGKSEFQIRPVVLPPQLNAPKEEGKNKEAKVQDEKKDQDKKPMTMKEAFGDKDPFATRPIFPMAQQDYERRKLNQQASPFGTRFAQNMPNNSSKGQGKISLDFLNSTQSASRKASFGGQRPAQMPQMMNFDSVQRAAKSLDAGSRSKGLASGGNMPRNAQGFSTGTSSNRMANFDRANMNTEGRNFGGSLTQRTPEMDAIIAKRQREFENYKRQKDSLKLDGQEVNMSDLPPKLKRILVMGILDKKKYD